MALLPNRHPTITAHDGGALLLWRGQGPRIHVTGAAIAARLGVKQERLGPRTLEGFARNHLASILAEAERRLRAGEVGYIEIHSLGRG